MCSGDLQINLFPKILIFCLKIALISNPLSPQPIISIIPGTGRPGETRRSWEETRNVRFKPLSTLICILSLLSYVCNAYENKEL